MSLTKILTIILSITALGLVVALIIFGFEDFQTWFQKIFIDLFLAVIMAVIVGLIIDWIYRRYSPQSKILKTTMTHSPSNNISYAKLILPNNNNIVVDGAERIVGREDFVGIISTDKLLYIGKDHLKITKEGDNFYIQDLNTKNGTSINGEKLSGNKSRLLSSGDELEVGKTVKIYYQEKI
jgi:pSer/pThr/pTyr-binding forkhead associated (FHA) protein